MTREPVTGAGDSALSVVMATATRAAIAYPWATIVLAVALAAASLWLTCTRLGYRTSRLDLLNPESDYNRLWIEYLDEFGDEDDAVIVVEGAGRDEVVPVLEEISAALNREDRLFHTVLHEVDLSKVRAKGLYYLPPDELLAIERFVADVEPILEGHWSRLNLRQMTAGMTARLDAEVQQVSTAASEGSALKDVERLTEGLVAALDGERGYRSPWHEMPQSFATLSELNTEYLLTKEGQLGFVLLRLARDDDSFAQGAEAIQALRGLIDRTEAAHPGVRVGLTGLPIMEHDEMRASQSSMLWASLVSLGGVALLFVAGFGGVRHALLANVVLLVGMAWSFGYATLAVGHLNILSVSFTVTLIGIGIDYGVYYTARYLQCRGQGLGCREALLSTARVVSPAIVTGALTTAVSFFAAGFTPFTGVAELGMIAGGGIMLCAAAELLVLPAAICLVDRGEVGARMPDPLPVDAWLRPFSRAPRLVLAASVAAIVVVSSGLSDLWYDHNLLNLQPIGEESVELERRLLSESNQSMWYALSIADDREELLARKAEFLKLASVERTEEIVSLLPTDHESKQPIISRIRARLATLPERPPLIPVDRPEDLGRVLAAAQDAAARRRDGGLAARQLESARDVLRRMPLADCYERISHFQQQLAGDLLSRLYALKLMADPAPPQLSDLPPSLVDRFVGQHGRHLLKIYGRGDIWDMDALQGFVRDVRSVDSRATGNPLQAYEASLEMKLSFERSALYALGVILIVLWADFRNLRHSLLALLPLGLGMLLTFGLLGLLNIPLNPANMIALPLILGIGIDYGVHIVHELREGTGPYRLGKGTAVAVAVDGLTTIVGFGSLMIASHQGLQSLGRVLTIGITCCMFTSMVMLPAVLSWLTRESAPPDRSLGSVTANSHLELK